MDGVITIVAEVIHSEISWSWCGGLAAYQVAALSRAASDTIIRVCERWINANITVGQDSVELEVSGSKVALFLIRTCIQDIYDLGCLLVRDVRDELERVIERRNDERVIVCEWSLGKIKANAASVNDYQTGILLACFVDHDCRKGRLQKLEDITIRTIWLAVLTVSFWSTSIKTGKVEPSAFFCNLRSDGNAFGRAKFVKILTTLSMVCECPTIPVQVASGIAQVGRRG